MYYTCLGSLSQRGICPSTVPVFVFVDKIDWYYTPFLFQQQKKLTMETCSICVENLNKTSRSLVKCEYCDHNACKSCYQRYILDLTQPKCMNNGCERPWTRKFLAQTFSHSFINITLRKHREQVLFEKERALLPSTQPIVENIIKSEKIRAEMLELQNRIMEMAIESNRLLNRRFVVGERAHFVRACPDAECRGFLSSQWKCGICEKWTCPTCHELKGMARDVEHTCHPDNVATAQLLANDTKPCPNCGTGIFKIDGCDQMWCTECRTAFSWRTGRIQAHVHNPHYYEWLRRSGAELAREPGDVPCAREITNMTARQIVTVMKVHDRYTLSQLREDGIFRLCRQIVHLRYATRERYDVATEHDIDNQDLRIEYLRNRISETAFKTLLQRNDKRIQKKREIHGIIQLVVQTLTDIVLRFQSEVTTNIAWNNDYSILDESLAIKEYANECLQEVAKTFGSKALTYDSL